MSELLKDIFCGNTKWMLYNKGSTINHLRGRGEDFRWINFFYR